MQVNGFNSASNDHKYKKIKSLVYSLNYAETCNRFGGHLRIIAPWRHSSFQSYSMSQRWQAVGIAVSDLIGPRFEPQIYRSRDEHVTARLTG